MKTWALEFKPTRGRGSWVCPTVTANTREGAIAEGWRLLKWIDGNGAYKLVRCYEKPAEECAA